MCPQVPAVWCHLGLQQLFTAVNICGNLSFVARFPRTTPLHKETEMPQIVPPSARCPPPTDTAHLVVLGGYGARVLLDRASELGVRTLLVIPPDRITDADYRGADRTIVVPSFDDPLLLPLLRTVHAATPITQCVSLTETGLLPTARINEALGLPAVSTRTAALARDKARMRELLGARGLSPVAARRCASLGEAAEFGGRHGYPIIIKPVDGCGSAAVALARDPDAVEPAFRAALGESSSGVVLCEEYLDGPEYSVETFSFAGDHLVLGIVGKRLNEGGFVEIGHVVPATVEPATAEAIRATTSELLDAIGLTDGPAHTEIKVTAHGVRVIETHNRTGGDWIPDLIRMTTGVDLYQLTLGWAAGVVDPVRDVVTTGGAAIRFCTPPPGRLVSVTGLDRVGAEPGVVEHGFSRKVGSRVPVVRSSSDRSGYVVARGRTTEEAEQACQRALSHLRVTVDEEDGRV
ncbi:ATP-grasp domain-containing protein [Micromonospora chokoriensis]